MSGDDKGPRSSEEIFAANMFRSGQPTPEDIQLGISRAMAGVVAKDARSNPNALLPPNTVRVANAPTVVTAGVKPEWKDEMPLPGPNRREVELIDRLADKFCGPPNGPVK